MQAVIPNIPAFEFAARRLEAMGYKASHVLSDFAEEGRSEAQYVERDAVRSAAAAEFDYAEASVMFSEMMGEELLAAIKNSQPEIVGQLICAEFTDWLEATVKHNADAAEEAADFEQQMRGAL